MPDKFYKNHQAPQGRLCEESQMDGLAERLLSAPAITCGADFADRTIEAAKSDDAGYDILIDALLKASPVRLGADFDRRAALACRKAVKGARGTAAALASMSAAACAALAVIAAVNSRTYGARDAFNLRDDYTKITEMTREISDLSVFIVQEDFFNAIQPPMR